jgi:ankyrin repeat protein
VNRNQIDEKFERAVMQGDLSEIRPFFRRDRSEHPSVQSQKRAIFIAAKRNKGDIISHLLEGPHARCLDVNVVVEDPLGSPLHAAAAFGNRDIVKKLLQHGAEPNLRCGKYGTALYAAVYYNRLQIVSLLLANNADINARGHQFNHVLEVAAHLKHWGIVWCLLDNKVEDNEVDWTLVGKGFRLSIKAQADIERRRSV